MKLRCPECREPLTPGDWHCPNRHRFFEDEGVLILLREDFRAHLEVFLKNFSRVRREMHGSTLAPEDYPLLPYGKAVADNPEWRVRQLDLEIALPLIERRDGPLTILELGAYNGWLTHHLAARGHEVTVIDYFLDDLDGLKTRRFYREKWRSIQMDIRNTGLFAARFDLIIFNRCLQFFENPLGYFDQLAGMLNPGGMILLLGMQMFKDPRLKLAAMARQQAAFREQHHFDNFLVPLKGYLDFEDRAGLRRRGVRLIPYARLAAANLRSLLQPTLPRHYYGVYQT
ncbi:MAG: methyltransferase domain-containing protein [Calditrichae bacterium]|nr:methyltransferase domain-containing protein [Calditrichia bacterium]